MKLTKFEKELIGFFRKSTSVYLYIHDVEDEKALKKLLPSGEDRDMDGTKLRSYEKTEDGKEMRVVAFMKERK